MITTRKVKHAFINFLILSSVVAWAQSSDKIQEEKELEVVDFSNIKKVLKEDGLSQSAQEVQEKVAVMKEEKVIIDNSRYAYPNEVELMGFMTEYWLVKNAQLLDWDFQKPDYGIENSFSKLLEQFGFFQKKFKVLLLNTPTLVRAALPGPDNEMVFLLSVPFIRSLDLTKLEISLLLLEDFFRLESGYFVKAVMTDKAKGLAGGNFHGTKPDLSMIEELMKNYDKQINEKGYTFQQQFEVTKKMDAYLKSNPELWNSYFKLVGKIEKFLKTNAQYKTYIKLYPSPDMQIKWLSPEEKVL